MNDLIPFALAHPLSVIAFLLLNSVAMMVAGIWLGAQRSKFVTKTYFYSQIESLKKETARIQDDMANRYQRTMESSALRMKEILDQHTGKVADFLRGVATDAEETRKTLKSLTKDTSQMKGALAVLLPKGAAAEIFNNNEEVPE